ncbi:MAG: class I SAM-dependent methyltransferase [Nocardioidaceae bacterium]|nr:class I SAM-dependent methyltransferase [Nocardioidaceae bacterium]
MNEHDLPLTRWARAERGYGRRFAELLERGEDIVGEARLAHTMAPPHGRILDVGSGMGRIGAHLLTLGHQVVAAEPDPELVAQSRSTWPDLDVVPHEILALTPQVLTTAGHPTQYDVITCIGNVLPFVAEGTEVRVLRRLAEFLAPDGRILVGFHLSGGPVTEGPESARHYTVAEFHDDVAAAGLRIDHHFGGYDLRPADDEFAVWVLSPAPPLGGAQEVTIGGSD